MTHEERLLSILKVIDESMQSTIAYGLDNSEQAKVIWDDIKNFYIPKIKSSYFLLDEFVNKIIKTIYFQFENLDKKMNSNTLPIVKKYFEQSSIKKDIENIYKTMNAQANQEAIQQTKEFEKKQILTQTLPPPEYAIPDASITMPEATYAEESSQPKLPPKTQITETKKPAPVIEPPKVEPLKAEGIFEMGPMMPSAKIEYQDLGIPPYTSESWTFEPYSGETVKVKGNTMETAFLLVGIGLLLYLLTRD